MSHLVESAVDIGLAFSNHRMGQHRGEIIPFLDWLLSRGPLERVIEIGTYYGGLTRTFCELASKQVIGIDLPGGPGGIPLPNCLERDERLERACMHYSAVHGDSLDFNTIILLETMLGANKVDLLFIDGNHNGIYPYTDYENFRRFVKPDGVVAFHDTNSYLGFPNVRQIWRIVGDLHKGTMEFSVKAGWGGIGVVLL